MGVIAATSKSHRILGRGFRILREAVHWVDQSKGFLVTSDVAMG